MRKHRWIAPVWGLVATASFGQAAFAQAPASPLDGPFPPVGPAAGPPVAPQGTSYAANPTYTPIAPDAASQAGLAPGMRPWPTISPYDHALDQTYNDDGIWFREMLNHERKYKINVDFISGRFRQPGNTVVGADVLNLISDEIENREPDLTPTSPASQFNQDLIGVKEFLGVDSFGRYFPNGITGATAAVPVAGLPPLRGAYNQVITILAPPGGTQQNQTTGGQSVDFTYPHITEGLAPVVNINGDATSITDAADGTATDEVSGTIVMTVTGGVLAEDATPRFGGFDDVVGQKRQNPASPGLRLVFGLEDEDQSGFDWTGFWISGQAQTFSRGLDDPTRPRLTNMVMFQSAFTTLDVRGVGSNLPMYEVLDYNQLFRLKHESETAGTDLALYHTPMVDYGWLVLRPLYGARYNYISEQFNFTGRDNGLFVVYNQRGAAQEGKVLPNNPNVGPLTAYSIFPYETSVTSKVQSHLYGPEVGADMQLGGEYFTINSAVKTGVVANTEKLALGAYGFGLQEAITGQRAFFSDSKTHTRVAPFVEFNANADMNIFPIIPYVNRAPFFKNARLNAGWSTLVVGNLQRPMDQIVWRAESAGGPYIKERGRDAWYVQYWNVGVHWKF